jgi:hypothetical protein
MTTSEFPRADAFLCGAGIRLMPDAASGAARCCRHGRHIVAKWSVG